MKALHTSSGWLMCIVVATLAQQIATYTMEETCAYFSEGFIADPNNCQGYGYCQNGTIVAQGICPPGYVYNSDDATCDYPSKFQCKVASAKSICQNQKDGSTFADPDNCSRYCQCQNGIAVCNTCPSNQKYNSASNSCVWKTDKTVICLSDSICRLIPNGKFVGNTDGCGGYILCTLSGESKGNCKEGYIFNPQTGQCETGTLPNSCGNSNSGTNGKNCQNYNTTINGIQYVSDKTCYGYYICKSSDDPGTYGTCPPNLHFNGELQKCVTPYTFACEYDRCGNMDQQFMGAIGSNCQNYLYCKNQTAVIHGDNYEGSPCPEGLYFNEFFGTCGPNNPNDNDEYKLCTTTISS